MDDPIIGHIPEGYKAPPAIRLVRTWGDPDEDGTRLGKSYMEFDGERFPYMTSGQKPVHDLVPGHPEMGKVVYVPVIAASFDEVKLPVPSD